VLYGSVPVLVKPEKRARAFGIFYTATIGAGAAAPVLFGFLGDMLGVHFTGLKTEANEWLAAGGWARDSAGRSSPYVRLGLVTRQ
jgi:MFS family permease